MEMNLGPFYSIKSLNSILKLIMDLIHWLEDKWFIWKEGATTGVEPPSDEDVPNNAELSSQLIKCAGAFWRPYYLIKTGMVNVLIPMYLKGKVGPFCLACKAPVEREGRSIIKPYFKWRCQKNHIHRIPKFFQRALLTKVKIQIEWELTKLMKNIHDK